MRYEPRQYVISEPGPELTSDILIPYAIRGDIHSVVPDVKRDGTITGFMEIRCRHVEVTDLLK